MDYEITRVSDSERRRKLERIASISIGKIFSDEDIAARAVEIENLGLRAVDILHISCEEKICRCNIDNTTSKKNWFCRVF
jgi:hypothetical protein